MSNIEAKLTELGLKLPDPPAVAGAYVPFVRSDNLLFLAGTISSFNGQMTHTGQVGKEQTVQAGYDSARICALNTLANIKAVPAAHIDAESAAGPAHVNTSMPPASASAQPTEAERLKLGEWLACGTP